MRRTCCQQSRGITTVNAVRNRCVRIISVSLACVAEVETGSNGTFRDPPSSLRRRGGGWRNNHHYYYCYFITTTMHAVCARPVVRKRVRALVRTDISFERLSARAAHVKLHVHTFSLQCELNFR